jgi:Uma2 family endonuclease
MSVHKHQYMSVQAYLAQERTTGVKHEYLAGTVYAMAGGSARHNRIAGNTYASLHGQVRDRPCTAYTSDMRVRIPQTGLYTYPNITIVCGHEQFEDEHEDILTNPILLIEVLSPSTENYDRGKKFQHYRNILSLREYILIAQDDYHIERYVRQPDNQWLFSEIIQRDDHIELTSIQCVLHMADVYAKITFPAPTDEG